MAEVSQITQEQALTPSTKTDIYQDFFSKVGNPPPEVIVTDQSPALPPPETGGSELAVPAPNQPVVAEQPSQTVAREMLQPPQVELEITLADDPESLQAYLSDAITNPGNWQTAEVEELFSKVLNGRSFDELPEDSWEKTALQEFLDTHNQKIDQTSLELAQALEESAEDQEPAPTEEVEIEPEEITTVDIENENVEKLLENDREELVLETTDKNGKKEKYSIKQLAALAAFVATDLALFRGYHTSVTLDKILGSGVHGATNAVLGKLGFQIPESFLDSHRDRLYEELFNTIDTYQLIKFLDNLPPKGTEIAQFLEGIGDENRKKMLAGEGFGKFSKHQLGPEVIQRITDKLSDRQKEHLGIQTQVPS